MDNFEIDPYGELTPDERLQVLEALAQYDRREPDEPTQDELDQIWLEVSL